MKLKYTRYMLKILFEIKRERCNNHNVIFNVSYLYSFEKSTDEDEKETYILREKTECMCRFWLFQI